MGPVTAMAAGSHAFEDSFMDGPVWLIYAGLFTGRTHIFQKFRRQAREFIHMAHQLVERSDVEVNAVIPGKTNYLLRRR